MLDRGLFSSHSYSSWTPLLMAFFHIHFSLLLSWTLIQIPLLFFLSTPTFSTLLLLSISYLLLWNPSWYPSKILPQSCIPIVLLPNPLIYSPSKHLLILPTHITAPIEFALPLLPLLSLFLCTVYMLSQNLRPLLRSYQTLVALLSQYLLLPFLLLLLLLVLLVLQFVLGAVLWWQDS